MSKSLGGPFSTAFSRLRTTHAPLKSSISLILYAKTQYGDLLGSSWTLQGLIGRLQELLGCHLEPFGASNTSFWSLFSPSGSFWELILNISCVFRKVAPPLVQYFVLLGRYLLEIGLRTMIFSTTTRKNT